MAINMINTEKTGAGKKCIIVLGMHRSGTSATMGVLNMLGVSMHSELLQADSDNEKGYYEQVEMMQINDRFLATVESSWDDFGRIELDTIDVDGELPAMTALISQEMAESDVFGFKDPRLCRLFPLWIDVLKAQGIDVACVIPLRDPHEVISSLVKRDGFSLTKSMMLWETSMLDAELYSRDIPRVFIKFDDLLNNTATVIDKVESALQATLPYRYSAKSREISEFLDSSMRHHVADGSGWENIALPGARKLWAQLEALSKSGNEKDTHILEKIDAIRSDYSFEAKDIARTAARVKNIHIENIETALFEAKYDLKDKEFELQQIHDSIIWKMLDRYYELRDLILPRGSKRRNLVKYCRNIFKLLNLTNIIKSLPYIKKRGLRAFICKLKENTEARRPLVYNDALYDSPYHAWFSNNEPATKDLIVQSKTAFPYEPTISIIVPTYNTKEQFLLDMLESVLAQTYGNWELCIADGGSTEEHVVRTLREYEKNDSRIKLNVLSKNEGIAGNSNAALSIATGDYIALLDHDDTLAPFALFEIVSAINKHADVDFVYSDEDKIPENGELRYDVMFKPDWSPDTLLSHNYICHFTCIRKSLVDAVGGFRSDYDGSQDYDLFLRATGAARRIVHVPKVLYHWREHKESAAQGIRKKPYATDAAIRAIADYLQNSSEHGADVTEGILAGTYKVSYAIKDSPQVAIIIPTKDMHDVLKRCVDSILSKTIYDNYTIYIIDNGSSEQSTFDYYETLKGIDNIRIINYDKPFNYSAINNYAVSKTDADLLLLLNNDVEVISPEWLSSMVSHCQRSEVGAVGAKLYYPNNTIQHAGVIVGLGGVAGHSHKHFHRKASGYCNRILITQNFSAITAACLMVRREVFNQVGGLDEQYAYAFNDVDFCMKMREKGYRIIYTPYAELYHHESLSRGHDDTPEKKERFRGEVMRFQRKWESELKKGDPYYSPNLTLHEEDFSINLYGKR